MDGILKIAELLGEDNEQKLKDGITEMLLNVVRDDLNDIDYLLEFENLFEDVRDEIFDNVKNKMIEKYTKEIEAKFEKLFQLMIQKEG